MDANLHTQTCQAVHERYPLLGLARAVHTNRRSRPLVFQDKPFLIPLYAQLPDLVGEAVFCKGVQTGISELLIQLSLYTTGWNHRIAAYVLPQYRTAERFVADRVDPVILRTPAYAKRLPGGAMGLSDGGGNNLKRKRFGPHGSLLFLGSNTASDFVEFSADLVIVDEYDECKMDNLAKIKDRTRESDSPQVIRVSNPSNPRGVSRLWKEGTRARWNHRCGRCGHAQPLDWHTHFVRKSTVAGWEPRDDERADDPSLGDIRPVCLHCHRPFDRTGEGALWLAEEPSRSVQSFHISRLDVLASGRDPQPMRAALREYQAAQGDTRRLKAFYAGILGWIYEPQGSRITDDVLDAAEAAGIPLMDHDGGEDYEERAIVMGVDVGSLLNVIIDEVVPDDDAPGGYRREGVWVGVCSDFEELIRLQEKYDVKVMVIDAMPETRKAMEIRDHFIYHGGCDVWLCRYHPTPRVGVDAFGLRIKWDEQVITVDRTQVMDATMDEINAGARTLPGDASTVLGFRAQMKAPTRRFDEGRQRFVWEEGSDPDHFRHAGIYSRVAVEIHDRSGGYFE